MKGKLVKRLTALGLSVVLAISLVPGLGVSAARSAEDIQAEQTALENKQAELRDQIIAIQEEKADSIEHHEKIEEQIGLVQQQVTGATNGIKTLDASIVALTDKIALAETKYADVIEQFKQRVKAIYKAGNVSTLEILLNAESFSEYSMRIELMKSFSKRDQQLADKINEFALATQSERTQLQAEKDEVAALKKSLDSKTSELSALETENQRIIDTLSLNENNTENDLNVSYAYSDDLANQMADLIAQKKEEQATPRPTAKPKPTAAPTAAPTPLPEVPDGEPAGGTETPKPKPTPEPEPEPEPEPDPPSEDGVSFTWPCPGYVFISATWGDGRNHQGIDMAANYGTPILAAEAGTILIANNSDSWGSGWGYYISIYHNPTYATLYAHCSSLAVSVGDYVEKGQIIGYVGSTGNSTGNHLHFEVYVDGRRTDPAPYLYS